jgi:chemosensory pili system protein ChpA (sensor histidine kinase/response regulator)
LETKPLALIIEDHEDQALVFIKALERAGYRTEAVQDGLTAQKRLDEIIPDMIILDLHIPNVDGSILLGQIRSDQRLKDVPVILATADAALASSLQAQSDLVLLKPISFSQLSQLAGRYHRHLGSQDSEQSGSQDSPPSKFLV